MKCCYKLTGMQCRISDQLSDTIYNRTCQCVRRTIIEVSVTIEPSHCTFKDWCFSLILDLVTKTKIKIVWPKHIFACQNLLMCWNISMNDCKITNSPQMCKEVSISRKLRFVPTFNLCCMYIIYSPRQLVQFYTNLESVPVPQNRRHKHTINQCLKCNIYLMQPLKRLH